MAAKKKSSKPRKSNGSNGGNPPSPVEKMEAAKMAASAAERLTLLDDDDEEEDEDEEEVVLKDQNAEGSKERISKFDEQMKEVVAKRKSSEELDVRGTRLPTNPSRNAQSNKLDELDQRIKAALRGEPTEKKKETKIKTETGEELYLTEFAPGASISPFALPKDLDDLYMPLPSELVAKIRIDMKMMMMRRMRRRRQTRRWWGDRERRRE
mmetsp:Transcript_22187/g.73040  ORF Transcript_22187/g.73040 Transcript_22187/m.73040 type:complete len:210 (-) Transcript_22187:677-1306(-)